LGQGLKCVAGARKSKEYQKMAKWKKRIRKEENVRKGQVEKKKMSAPAR